MLLSSYIDIGLILAFIGAAGILTNHQHILLSLLSVELMFYGLNFFPWGHIAVKVISCKFFKQKVEGGWVELPFYVMKAYRWLAEWTGT